MKDSHRTDAEKAQIRYVFGDGDTTVLPLVNVAERMILEYAAMISSDSPRLRQQGRLKIREVAMAAIHGGLFLDKQTNNARKKRTTIKDGNGESTSIQKIVEGLIRQHGEISTAELWPHFVSELGRLDLDPQEDIAPDRKGDKLSRVTFDDGRPDARAPRRTVDINSFRSTKSRARKAIAGKSET